MFGVKIVGREKKWGSLTRQGEWWGGVKGIERLIKSGNSVRSKRSPNQKRSRGGGLEVVKAEQSCPMGDKKEEGQCKKKGQ